MASIFTRKRSRQEEQDRVRFRQEEGARLAGMARSAPAVLRASGVRIKPMSPERMRALAGNRQPWQSLAWGYRDMIGELRFALQFRARAISRVQFFAAQVSDKEDEPLPLALRNEVGEDGRPTEKSQAITLAPDLCAAAEQELARLPLDAGYSFLGVWSENFDVAGECYLHGREDPDTGQEVWEIRSVDDVEVQGSDVSLKDELGQPRRVDLDAEEVYRLWVPHPRRGHLADASLNALMDVLEDIVLIGRELRAAARSRIATNGVILVPDGMVRPNNTREDDELTPREIFMADFTAALLAPISNEGDAGAVAPAVLIGNKEDLKEFRHVTFAREDSPTLLDKLAKSLARLANSLDIPPEILTGMAEVNHWTAWQIDASTFRHHLEPGIRLMVDSITQSFLRAALIHRGFQAAEVAKVRIWYDAGQITENPNRRDDAIAARKELAIGDAAFRDALGFGPADAPTPEEVLAMIAGKQGMDQSAAYAILHWAATQAGVEPPPPPTVPAIGPARPAVAPESEPEPAAPGPPETAPSGIAAAAGSPWPNVCECGSYADHNGVCVSSPRVHAALLGLPDDHGVVVAAAPPTSTPYRLNTETGRQLMELDRALRTQILTAADAAIAAALQRSGSRLRAKATKNPAIAASLKDIPVTLWAENIGKTQALALGADTGFLLAAAWDDLQGKFTRWVTAAVDDVIGRVLAMLGVDPVSRGGRATADRMRADMGARIDPAWSRLEAALTELADEMMFGEFEPEDESGVGDGELPEFNTPEYLVRTALAEVGGLPETSGGVDHRGRPVTGEPLNGLGTGTTVTATLEDAGVLTVGYLWVYGVTPMLRRFEPHWLLEGERFESWADPKLDTGPRYAWLGDHFRPGDHVGCMCDYVPGYAIPEYSDAVRDALGKPSKPTEDILSLAAGDDAAGRTGTTAQAVRDQWQAIQKLQARFLNGE